MRSMEKDMGTVWGYSGEGYSMEYGIQWRRVQYGDKGKVWGYTGERVQYRDTVEKGTVWNTVDKGKVWRYNGEEYSMGIQWRRVQYGIQWRRVQYGVWNTVEKGTVWG